MGEPALKSEVTNHLEVVADNTKKTEVVSEFRMRSDTAKHLEVEEADILNNSSMYQFYTDVGHSLDIPATYVGYALASIERSAGRGMEVFDLENPQDVADAIERIAKYDEGIKGLLKGGRAANEYARNNYSEFGVFEISDNS